MPIKLEISMRVAKWKESECPMDKLLLISTYKYFTYLYSQTNYPLVYIHRYSYSYNHHQYYYIAVYKLPFQYYIHWCHHMWSCQLPTHILSYMNTVMRYLPSDRYHSLGHRDSGHHKGLKLLKNNERCIRASCTAMNFMSLLSICRLHPIAEQGECVSPSHICSEGTTSN